MEPYSKEWYELREIMRKDCEGMAAGVIRKEDIKPIAIWLTKAVVIAAMIISLPILAS